MPGVNSRVSEKCAIIISPISQIQTELKQIKWERKQKKKSEFWVCWCFMSIFSTHNKGVECGFHQFSQWLIPNKMCRVYLSFIVFSLSQFIILSEILYFYSFSIRFALSPRLLLSQSSCIVTVFYDWWVIHLIHLESSNPSLCFLILLFLFCLLNCDQS